MSDESATRDVYALLSRGVPESAGYHEVEWSDAEIAEADKALTAIRSITWEDVRLLRERAEEGEHRIMHPSGETSPDPEILDLAARIAALLPPEVK